MSKRRSAYHIPFGKVVLQEEEKRRAVEWWQSGTEYHPLLCPVCGSRLSLPARGVGLKCPTVWCVYATEEIPWAVFTAYQRHLGRSGGE